MFDPKGILAVEEPKDRIAELEAELSRRRNGMADFYAEWDLNQAMHAGNQWVSFVRGRGLVNYNRWHPTKRKRYTVNIIRLYCRNMASLLTQRQPTIRVQPDSYEANDVRAAEAGDAVFKHHRRLRANMHLPLRRVNDMLLFGVNWILVHWDPLWGEYVFGPDGEFILDGQGRPVREGRITWTRVHPRCVFPTPEAESFEEMHDVFIQRIMPVALARRLWPKFAKQIKPSEGLGDYRRWRELSVPGVPTPSGAYKDYTMIGEYRVDGRTSGQKRGRIIQWNGTTELYNDDGLFSDGSLGLVGARFDTTDETVMGSTYVGDLIDVQVNLNRRVTQIMQFHEKSIAGIYCVEKGSGVEEADLRDTRVDRVIEVNRGFQYPRDIVDRNIGQTIFQELELSMRFLQDLGSQHTVVRGESDPAVRSARQAAFLREQNNTTLGQPISEIGYSDAELCRLTLLLVQDRWRDDRLIRTLGESQVAQAIKLKAADLPREIDVDYVLGSALPKSEVVRFDELIEALKLPIADPQFKQADRVMWAQMVESVGDFGGLQQGFLKDIKLHQANAQKENVLLLQGSDTPPIVREFEDDTWHILEHERCQNSPEYSSTTDEGRVALDFHVSAHRLSMSLKAMGAFDSIPEIMREYQQTKQREAALAVLQRLRPDLFAQLSGQPEGGAPA